MFHWFNQFQTINALLLQISKCRELRVFGLILLSQKLRLLNFFFIKYQVCQQVVWVRALWTCEAFNLNHSHACSLFSPYVVHNALFCTPVQNPSDACSLFPPWCIQHSNTPGASSILVQVQFWCMFNSGACSLFNSGACSYPVRTAL